MEWFRVFRFIIYLWNIVSFLKFYEYLCHNIQFYQAKTNKGKYLFLIAIKIRIQNMLQWILYSKNTHDKVSKNFELQSRIFGKIFILLFLFISFSFKYSLWLDYKSMDTPMHTSTESLHDEMSWFILFIRRLI